MVVTSYFGGGKTQIDFLIESSMPARLATAFVAVFTAPLVEELIYRGVLYRALEKAGARAYAIASCRYYSQACTSFNTATISRLSLSSLLLSITLTVARAVTGKVLPSFIIHLVFNGIQSLVLVLAPFHHRSMMFTS